MNNSQREIQEQKAILKEQVKLAEVVKRLEENEDYKVLFKHYTDDYALLCLRMANNVNCYDDIRTKYATSANACGMFFNYIDSIKAAGIAAKKELVELQEEEDNALKAEEQGE